jgi:carbohydrate diacid regulator
VLSGKIAQMIVDRTLSVVGENINIFDKEGMIIASGDQSRIGSLHAGAKKCIETKNVVEADWDTVGVWPGLLYPGISLPIFINNGIVGAVGITGELVKVRDYANLVKITVELMLEQKLLESQFHIHNRNKESLILDLFEGGDKNDSDFELKAHAFGLRFHLPCLVILLEFNNLVPTDENLNRNLIDQLINSLVNSKDIRSFVYLKNYVILKHFDRNKSEYHRNQEITHITNSLKKKLKDSLGLDISIGVGGFYEGYEGLKISYKEAKLSLLLGELANIKTPYFIENLQIESLIYSVPKQSRQKFLSSKAEKIFNDISNKKELVLTLKTFFECNLNTNKTSTELYLHRNTVFSRLKKIKKITSLDPYNFRDAVHLYLALLCYELIELDK